MIEKTNSVFINDNKYSKQYYIMILEELDSLYYDNWRHLTQHEIEEEYRYKIKKPEYIRRFQNLGTNVFDSFENFEKAVKNAKEIRLTLDHDYQINRRSFTSSIDELNDMISSYRSAAKRIGMPERILKGFEDDDAIPMPLILKIGNEEWIIAGNTRLDVARIANIKPDPKVLLIENVLTERADVIKTPETTIYKNPNVQRTLKLLDEAERYSEQRLIRGLVDYENNVWIWNGYDEWHHGVIVELNRNYGYSASELIEFALTYDDFEEKYILWSDEKDLVANNKGFDRATQGFQLII